MPPWSPSSTSSTVLIKRRSKPPITSMDNIPRLLIPWIIKTPFCTCWALVKVGFPIVLAPTSSYNKRDDVKPLPRTHGTVIGGSLNKSFDLMIREVVITLRREGRVSEGVRSDVNVYNEE